MLLRLATLVLCLSAISSGLPAAIRVSYPAELYQTVAEWFSSFVKQTLRLDLSSEL